MAPKVKICGMRERANIEAVAALRPDYMGFIYYPKSPRYVGNQEIVPATGGMSGIRRTAVLVNEAPEAALALIRSHGYEAVQLHGEETPAYCRRLKEEGAELIKAFGVGPGFDFARLEEFLPCCDYFLFDAKTSAYGGSGKAFPWEQLRQYGLEKPFFLSGGLAPENIREALAAMEGLPLYGLDLNSRFEVSPGLKDIQKVKEAINVIKNFQDGKE